MGPYIPGLSSTVLHWGCGDALAAERIADQVGTVLLYDGAASTRDRLRARYGSHSRILILSDFLLDEVATRSIDLIIANSVACSAMSAELTCRCPMLGRTWTGGCPMRNSNRSFGLLIGGVLLLVAGLHYWKERPDFFVWLIVAVVFIAVSLLMPRILAPLRRLWLKLGHLMSIVVSPIILALMYVLAIVVTGVLIRLFGKDLLSLKLKPAEASYWIKRNPPGPESKSLADQF